MWASNSGRSDARVMVRNWMVTTDDSRRGGVKMKVVAGSRFPYEQRDSSAAGLWTGTVSAGGVAARSSATEKGVVGK